MLLCWQTDKFRRHLTLLVLAMVATGLQPNPVEALVNGHVEHVDFGADAEFNVAGQAHRRLRLMLIRWPGRQERYFLATWIDHHHSGSCQRTGGQVDSPATVNCHSITARLAAKVDQCTAWPGNESIAAKRKRIDLHVTGGWLLRIGVNIVGTVVMICEIQGAAAGAECNPIRLGNLVGYFDHAAIPVDAVNGAVLQFAWFVANIARIGDIDPTLVIKAEVIE